MNTTLQTILVALLAAAAGLYLLRRVMRTLRPKDDGCGANCGCADGKLKVKN